MGMLDTMLMLDIIDESIKRKQENPVQKKSGIIPFLILMILILNIPFYIFAFLKIIN